MTGASNNTPPPSNVPVLYVSEQQLEQCIGTYLPTRKEAEGNFQLPLYRHSPPQTKMEGVDIPRLPVGTPVTKVLGYPFPGTVVAAFHTLSGRERFVVEATGEGYRGMLHIFNGDQLRATTEGQP